MKRNKEDGRSRRERKEDRNKRSPIKTKLREKSLREGAAQAAKARWDAASRPRASRNNL